MGRVRFSDVVKRVNVFVDREHTDLLYYVGGEHIDSDAFMVRKNGLIKGATIGYKFHFGFQPGHILFMSRNPHLRKCSMVDFAGVCSDSTYVVETRDENVLQQRYLLIEMQSDRFWKWAEENKSGSVNYLINYCTLDSYEFDLPPMSSGHWPRSFGRRTTSRRNTNISSPPPTKCSKPSSGRCLR